MQRVNNPALDVVRNGYYDPKMTEEQRCSALALFLNGASWRQVAAFFGVHYRTAQQIGNGPAYKSVREKLDKMGRDAFTAEYLTEATIISFNKWMSENRDQYENLHEKQKHDPNAKGWNPNKQASAKRGDHNVRSEDNGQLVTVHVKWIDATAEAKPGWFWSAPLLSTGLVGPYATSGDAFDGSKRVWDHANYRPRPQDLEQEPIPAPLVNPDFQAAVEKAKKARETMEQRPDKVTVASFAISAMLVFRTADPSITNEDAFDAIDWREFDPVPYLDEPWLSCYNRRTVEIQEDNDAGTDT
jgi:hypothetical protein